MKNKKLTDLDLKKKFEILEEGRLENSNLITEDEKEVATKILTLLDGNLTIRATSILKFCIKYVQYTDFNVF